MKSLAQALRFFTTHFTPLVLLCLLYTLPDYLIKAYLSAAYPKLTQEAEVKAALFILCIPLLFAPLRQAAQIYLMYAKRSGKSWSVAGALWVGLLFWPRLFLVNLVRLILIVALFLIVQRFSGLVGDSAVARFLLLLALIFGIVYIIVRFAYFDFLIVLERQTAFKAIKMSLQLTSNNARELLSSLLPISIFFVLMQGSATDVSDRSVASVMDLLFDTLQLSLVQAIFFTYFWNIRYESTTLKVVNS